MNKVLVAVVSGAIGMVVGSIGSYIFFKKKYESKYYEALEKAIDEECLAIRTRSAAARKIIVEGEKNIEVADHQDVPTTYEAAVQVAQLYSNNRPDPDEVNAGEGPMLIDEDEYHFLPPNYETRELQYFRGDGVFLDINDEMVEEPGIYIRGVEQELDRPPHLGHLYILIEDMKMAVDIEVIDEKYENVFGE